MNKELQTIGVWVKASERLPDNEGIVPIKTMSNQNHGFYDKEEDKFYYRQYTEWIPFDSTDGDWKNKVSWLSEQQRILLTQEEWESVQKLQEFQSNVRKWLLACFGKEISNDKIERNHRFLEEALELVQSTGCTKSEAHQLVDYVFERPIGEPYQEVGGAIVTLSALCSANELSMQECGEKELARIWTKVEKIREKQANKPKHSPLP